MRSRSLSALVMNEREMGEMHADLTHLKDLTNENKDDIKEILETLNKAKGGWKVGLAFATLAGAIAGYISKYIPG